MSQPVRPRVSVADDTVAAAARLLAAEGADAISAVLRLVHERYDAVVVLRSIADGAVIAQAPVVTPTQRRADDRPVLLELPVRHRDRTLAVLSVSRRRVMPSRLAEALRAVADVVGLTMAAAPVPYRVAAQAVLDAEADRAQLAADMDELREAVVALPHTDQATLPAAAAAALTAIREISRELRATTLVEGLRAALGELAGAGADVHADDPRLDQLPPAIAVIIERVVEASTRGAVETAQISASVAAGRVKLSVQSADNSVDASELERWARRANALGGDLRHWPGAVDVTLPAVPSDEGRHDDRPHL